MRNRLSLAFVFFASLLIGMAIMVTAQDPPADGELAASDVDAALAAATSWSIATVDSTALDGDDVGWYVSVVIDPASNTPYISYYDATNADLRVAEYVRSGGNCGPDVSWSCETVDSTGDVGKYTAIDIYTGTGGLAWKLGISYYDADSYALKYAEYAWSLASYEWTVEPIQSGSFASAYGMHTSLKFDSAGVPNISYYRSIALGDDALMHAQRVGSGGNCGPSSNWQCDAIDSGEGVGQYTSMDLYGAGYPQIAYYDRDSDQLKHAIYTGGSGSGCNPNNDKWVCNVIDFTGGKYASADRDSSGNLHIAYYDETCASLRYATHYGSGGNCGPSNTWYCGTLDIMGTSVNPMGISIAMDGDDYPFIAYQDTAVIPGHAVLKVAQVGHALASSSVVNPGLGYGPKTPSGLWYSEIVDSGGAYTDESSFVSIDVSPSGLATIAYYESDDYYYTGRLKVAYQRFRVHLPLVVSDS